jgi:two-component system LytT family response regulator
MAKILVIEDEQNIREVLKDILDLAGYDVQTANNGRLGYKAFSEERPDLVLCDVNMPGLNGFDLLSTINQRFEDEIIPPFLFLTANVEPENIRAGLNLGADDYITKPFDHRELLQIIKLRLGKREKIMSEKNSETNITIESKVSSFNKLALPSEGGLEIVSFEALMRVEAYGAYCKFYLSDGRKIMVSKPMKEFEEKLIQKKFFKVHKSSIVNLNFAEKYLNGKGGQLKMSDGSLITVSVRKKKELLEFFK